MSSGSFDYSYSNRIHRKQWNGANSPQGGPLQENAYSMYGYDCTKSGVIKQITNTTGAVNLVDPGWVASYTPIASWSSLELEALSKAATALRGHDFNAGVAIAEGKKTAQMVIGNLSKIYQFGRNAKRGNIAGAFRALGSTPGGKSSKKWPQGRPLSSRDLGNFYLENRYGWVPLLSDCYNGMEAYKRLVDDGYVFVTRGRASAREPFEASTQPPNFSLPAVHIMSCVVKVKVKEALSVPQSLGLSNPASIVWELVPFSFIFDWFMPIGSYLDVIGTIPKVGTTVVKSRRTIVRCVGPYTGKTGVVYTHYPACSISYKYSKLDRTVGGLAVPLPRLKPLGDVFNVKRVFDLVAIGRQLF